MKKIINITIIIIGIICLTGCNNKTTYNAEIKVKDMGVIKLTLDAGIEAIIKLDDRNRIIGYKNDYLNKCGDDFLAWNRVLEKLDLPNLVECGNCFLTSCLLIQDLNLPSLKKCGDEFLFYCKELKHLNLPKLCECGNFFLFGADKLTIVYLPLLEKCGMYFFDNARSLKKIYVPLLRDNSVLNRINDVIKMNIGQIDESNGRGRN